MLELGNSFGLWPLAACSALGGLVGSIAHMGHGANPKSPFGRTVKAAFHWLRRPLPDGPAWATWITLLWVAAVVALLFGVPADNPFRAFLLLLGPAVFCILLGLTRPRFFWRNGLVEGWRW